MKANPGSLRVFVDKAKWKPHAHAIEYSPSYLVPDCARAAEIAVAKLALELAGRGCGCRSPQELVDYLRGLGCEVSILGGPDEPPKHAN